MSISIESMMVGPKFNVVMGSTLTIRSCQVLPSQRTIHPDVSGRPHVLLMHERLIEHNDKHEGVEWSTMEHMQMISKARTIPPREPCCQRLGAKSSRRTKNEGDRAKAS